MLNIHWLLHIPPPTSVLICDTNYSKLFARSHVKGIIKRFIDRKSSLCSITPSTAPFSTRLQSVSEQIAILIWFLVPVSKSFSYDRSGSINFWPTFIDSQQVEPAHTHNIQTRANRTSLGFLEPRLNCNDILNSARAYLSMLNLKFADIFRDSRIGSVYGYLHNHSKTTIVWNVPFKRCRFVVHSILWYIVSGRKDTLFVVLGVQFVSCVHIKQTNFRIDACYWNIIS